MKKKRKTKVRTAFVSKKTRSNAKLDSDSDRPISDSSHESEIYREQMSTVDLREYKIPEDTPRDEDASKKSDAEN